MMNWSLIIFGLVALSSVTFAANSYLVIVPNLFKVGYDNQVSVFIAVASQPVEVKFVLTIGQYHLDNKIICKAGETRNITLTLPKEFPVGAGELTIIGTGGLNFEEKRDIIIYDNRHVILVQTSTATYRPRDTMEIRVVCTNENLLPVENGELIVEIYDAALKLVGEFPRVPISSGLTETLYYPLAEHVNVGVWLVSATIGNTTSSIEVLVSRPITPSFDLKAIFPQFLLRTDKYLRGVIEINNDENEPIFGRGIIAIGQIMEQGMEMQSKDDEWRQWKSQEIEIAGRMELNYDLLSLFNVDISKCLAVQVYIQVTELESGQERIVRHIIPVFTREVIYDIRPLEFEAGVKNEYEIIAKRPDGKPVKMEDMIVTVKMIIGNEQGKQQDEKSIEIKDFYTHGRNDIGFFNVEFPDNCIGVFMTITPLDETGKIRGYRTHALPLMPTPRRHGAKLSIELLPSTVAPANTNVNVPVVSSQISTVGRTSNFYIQLIPSKSVDKFERLPMSYVLMTNGRIILTGEFYIQPTKECQTKTVRTIQPEEQMPPVCVFNGTLPIGITRDMMPYSTLLVYTFQPLFGFYVAESYRFSVAGLFQSSLMLNATIVPFTSTETMIEYPTLMKEMNMMKPIKIPNKVQGKTRVELSFTGPSDSTVGLNVFEYDGVLYGLSNEITKERLLKYLTTYEQVPIIHMPTDLPSVMDRKRRAERIIKELDKDKRELKENLDETRRSISEDDEEELINRERMGYTVRYPIEKMIFGVSSSHPLPPVEGDDIYTTSNMGRLYGDLPYSSSSHYRRKLEKSINQYDVTVNDNDYVVATSVPLIFTAESKSKSMSSTSSPYDNVEVNEHEQPLYEKSSQYGTPSWYEKMNSKLNSFSQEAFTFMQSGLTFVSDFDSLHIPGEMKYKNFTKLFSKFRQQSFMMNQQPFGVRDEARQLLEEYISQTDLSMIPPPIMFEEQARVGYYRSIFFNTSLIGSQGVGKIVLPQTKPYSTWLATGFALNMKSGLSIAQPILLPTNPGLFVLANMPKQVQMGEHILLTYGINNYLGKDLTNVVLRIRASNDFDLMEQTKPGQVVSSSDKDYVVRIPSLKSFDVETRYMIVVPKRVGVIQIIIEVESEFGGDYEVLTVYVRESGIERKQTMVRLFDLTTEKSYGPFVEKINQSPALRSVRLTVSGTGLDRLIKPATMETNSLVGIDRSLVRLYRALALRQYLNETFQTDSPLFMMAAKNITTAYQKLQLYNDYDGSYSFISDEGTQHSSLYLTSIAFGAMISPMMPFRDNVTLNRTLDWILSHQQEDGSFDDDGPCFHYRYCAGKFRRESLTAIVLYSLTRDNSSYYMPEFIYERLYSGENNPLIRAQRYLESRVPYVKPDLLTITLFEMAFIQNNTLSPVLRGKIYEALLNRKLTTVPEDGSKYLNIVDEKMTFDDEFLLNAMTISLYAYFGDYKTTSDMARWVVSQLQIHPFYDSMLDAVFRTEAWLQLDCLFRKKFGIEKFDITVDVSADNGEKQLFKLNSKNMDLTQIFEFTLPVHQITYSVHGFGVATVRLFQIFGEQQQLMQQPVPFQLTQEFMPMPWFSEIKTKTCMTYTPMTQYQKFVTDNFNRTIVVEIELPSGTRVNMRQLGFFLSRVEQLMYFTYEPCGHKLIFFINVPSTVFGKPVCLEWCLERLSTVLVWSPIQIRVYDYLDQETQLVKLVPIQFQPNLMGYSFVEAVHQARPTLQSMASLQNQV